MKAIVLAIIAAFAILETQNTDLERLRKASAWVRSSAETSGADAAVTRQATDAFKAAVRDWVESRIPNARSAFEAEVGGLPARLKEELYKAGLVTKNPEDGTLEDWRAGRNGYGRIASFTFAQNDSLNDGFILTIATGVACGYDESIYAYRWTASGPVRILDASKTSRLFGEASTRLHFSEADSEGNRNLLVTSLGVQCGSDWNGLRYRLFRLAPGTAAATLLADDSRTIYTAADHAMEVNVAPGEFAIELTGESVDSEMAIRTHLLRYAIRSDAIERLDPVALQPQDFLEEWLRRPWSEMQQRSAAKNLGALEEAHKTLVGDDTFATFFPARRCGKGVSQFEMIVDRRNYKVTRVLFFLVRDLGNYRYEMQDVSPERQRGCKSIDGPSDTSPWVALKNVVGR